MVVVNGQNHSAVRHLGVDDGSALDQYLTAFVEDPGYLDFARVGPLSLPVVRARQETTSGLANPTSRTIDAAMGGQDRALARAASIAGLPVDRFVYVPNTSTGLFQVAFALSPRGSRDQVLMSSAEFPSNLYPWVRAHGAGGLLPVMTAVPDGRMTAAAVAELLTERTAAVAVSVVDFRTGYLTDLRAIREVIGDRLLIVDAIQGFGVCESDWAAADAIVVGGQKWLRAGWGTGFVAVTDRLRDGWTPRLSGWTGVEGAARYDGVVHAELPDAQALSLTNLSPIDQAGFAAALELVDAVGVSVIAHRISETASLLAQTLAEVGATVFSDPALNDPMRSGGTGIVPFAMPGRSPAQVHSRLLDAGISSTLHADRIRLSVHASSGPDSVAMVRDALR